uniref:Ecdysone receptor n=1 Tax=Romanomermis culicivorax TaxID=13658 RepID=A0A915KDE3_ROMCU
MTTATTAVAYQELAPVQMWTSNNSNNPGSTDEDHSRNNYQQGTDLLVGYHQDGHQINISLDNNQLWSFGGADSTNEHSIALPPLQMSIPTTSNDHWSMASSASTAPGQMMPPQLQHHSMPPPSYNMQHHHHHHHQAAKCNESSSSSSSRPQPQVFATGSTSGAARRKIVANASSASSMATNGGVGHKMINGVSLSSQPEELCLVCGDKASGYHYNALTCEGCKGSITRKALYYCKYGGRCDIDMYMRRKCQDCRLQKCVAVGMRAELVIPEEQCRLKRESKIKMRTSNGGNLNGNGSPSGNSESFSTKEERKSNSPQQNRNQLLPLLADLTVLNIQLIVDFAKCLPGFLTLCKNDQLILLKVSQKSQKSILFHLNNCFLKACCNELLVLKLAKHFDSKSDRIFCGQQPQSTLQDAYSWSFSREMFKEAGLGSCADGIFDFAKSMTTIKTDNAEYGLLGAISLYSDRPGLIEAKKVEDIQEVYTSALQSYIDVQRPKNRNVFARLLMKLTDIRTLGAQFADVILTRTTSTPQQQNPSINDDTCHFQRQQQHQDFHHKNGGDFHRNVSENNFKNLGAGGGMSTNTKQYGHFRRASYAGPSGNGTPIDINFKSEFSTTNTNYITSNNFRLIKTEPVNNNMAPSNLPPTMECFVIDDDPSSAVVDFFDSTTVAESSSSNNLNNFHAYVDSGAASSTNDNNNIKNDNNQRQPVMTCNNFPDFVKVDFFDTHDN